MPYTPMLYHARQARSLPAFLLACLFLSLLFASGAGCAWAQGGPISSGQSLPGALTTSSGRSVARGASYYADRYTFTASAGQIVTLSTTSGMDTYGYVYNPAGTQVASDDDSNGSANFKIVYTIPTSGTYTAEVTTYGQNVTGSYTLTFTAANGAAPTGLSAAGGNGSASLAWTAPAGASSFNVYRAASSGGPYARIAANGAAVSYADTPLTNGITYYYVVTANYPAGESGYSNQAAATPNVPPAAPTGLTATRGNAQVALSWAGSAGASSYNVYRGVSAGGEAASPVSIGVTGTSVTDTGLTNGTTYFYQVTAVNSGGEGPRSGEVSATPLSPPPAPQNVVARAGPGSASLIWTASPTATSYSVKRGTSSGGPFTLISGGSVTGTSVTDTGLTNGTTYYYVVSASNVMGEGANSYPAISVIPGSAPLPAPLLSASTSSGQTYISLNWTSVTGATSYNLYRSTAAAGEGTVPYKVNATSGTSTYFNDSGLTTSTTYYYKVVAVGAVGEGAFSNEASATPGSSALAAPTGLKAVAGSQQAALAWNAVTGATGYNLYRYVSGGSWLLYQIGLTTPSYTDTGLTNGTTYNYYVCAVSASGQGSQSSSVSAVPGSAAPAAPTGLRAQSGGSTSISLNWNAVTGASSYNVYRATTAGGEGSIPIATGISGSSTYYTDSSLTTGTTYYYRLTTVTASGEGSLSNEASATPGSTALSAPTGLKAVAGNAQIALTWGPVSGATSYNLYRYVSGGSWVLYQIGLTSSSYTDTGLTNATTYNYYVAGVNASGQGSTSSSVSAVPGSTAIASPTGLRAQPNGSTSVSLTWNSVAGASTYNVYRSTTAGGEGSVPLATGVSSSYYSDSGLTSGTPYYYVVTAVTTNGEGAPSNEASATPGSTALTAPSGLKAVAGNTQVALTWAPVAGATSYNLYRYISGSGGWILYQIKLTSASFTDTGLTNGTTYNYYVCGVSINGQGSNSSSVSAVPGSAAPAAPTGLRAQSSGSTSVSLTWNAVAGASTYNIYRGTAAAGEGSVPVATGVSSSYYSDSGLTAGTTYYYVVTAVTANGEGSPSNEASATPGSTALSAPMGLKAVAGTAQIALTWGPVAGAVTYNLYRYISGSGGWILYQVGLASSSYLDAGLTNGTTYSYYVAAVNAGGQGSTSSSVSAVPGSTAVPAPTGLRAQSGGSTSVSLTWNPVSSASSYNIYRNTTSQGEGAVPVATGVSSSYYSDSGLTTGTTYYYQVTAVTANGEGGPSNEASAIPGSAALAAPANLKAVAGNAQIALTWGPVSGATSYNLYRYISGSGGWMLYQISLSSPTFTDAGLTNGTTYSYYVAAVNVSGQGTTSSSVSAVPGSIAIAASTGLRAQSGGATSVSLTWNPVTNAASYNVYRSITAGGEGAVPIATGVSSSYYSDSGLTGGTTYYYQVTAVTANGEGTPSNEASAIPGSTALPAPATLKAVAGNAQISLAWSNVSGATSYNLYRYISGSSGWMLYQIKLASASFTDTGLTNGTTYSYYVAAVNASGQGTTSSSVSAVPGSSALAAPLLAASTAAGSSAITLTWTPVAGVSTYNVYRSTTAGGEGSAPYLSNQSGTSYQDSGLTGSPAPTYYYTVAAVSANGEGAPSNEASATPGSPQLAGPLLKGTVGSGQAILAWTAVTGATSYNLYRYTSSSYSVVLYQQGLTATTFTDTGLTNASAYTYLVRAVAVSGEGSSSNSVSLTPGTAALAAPVLTAQASGTVINQVDLTWTSVTGASSYNLYRSTVAGGEGNAPYKINLPSGSYSDTGLSIGTAYFYEVVAVGPGGEGLFSNEATATPNLPAPTNLAITISGSSQVTLTWTAVTTSGVTYRVYQGTAAGGESPNPVAYNLTATSATISGLTAGPTYYFVVKASSSGLVGPASNEVHTTLVSLPTLIAGGPAVSFTATGADPAASLVPSGSAGWDAVAPAGAVAASSSAANGWTESASGGSGSPVTFTLQAPATAVIGSGYELRSSAATPGYPASAFFRVVSAQTVATPAFSPNGGSFNTSLAVTISGITPGAVLFYTLDGTTPTAASTPYTGQVTLTSTKTLKVIGKLAGYTDSPVATATFTLLAAPTVTLTAPTEGQSIAAPGPVTLTATAASASSAVAKVEFFHANTKIGQATASPYTMSWTNVAAGSYTLTAKATDSNGLQTVSSPIHLTVAGGGTQLTLTAAGQALGFELTTFANNFPNTGAGGVGPLGITVSGNSVLVSDAPGNVRVFPTDADGQSAGAVPAAQNFGSGNAFGTALLNGNFYMAQQSNGAVVQLNANGTLNQTIVTGLGQAVGMQANPKTNHLFVSTGGGGSTIYDVDPAAKTSTVWLTNLAGPDGLALSADGSILYTALYNGSNIVGFSTSTKAKVFDYSTLNGGSGLSQMDGIALGYGALTGKIFANANNGFVYEIDLITGASTIIASGGSRGDFVGVDLNGQGALLLTQTDRIMRLFPFPAAGTSTIGIKSLVLNPASVPGGYSSTGTVTLTAAAPVGGLILQLSSSNASANVLGTVTVPAGQTTMTFPVGTVGVSAITYTTIQATVNGTYGSATLTINPASCTPAALASLALSASSLTIGQTVTGTVTLAGPALSGGQVVNLVCTPAALSLPASVTVLANATTATFTATALPVSVSTPVVIGASYHGTSFTQPVTIAAPAASAGSGGAGSGGTTSGPPPYLTSVGLAQGFTLSTFCPLISVPSGICVAPNGTVIVTTGYADGRTGSSTAYIFPRDSDNQPSSSAATYPSQVAGLAVSRGVVYGTIPGQSVVVVNPATGQPVPGLPLLQNSSIHSGIVVNPANGHLIVAGINILDIDPSQNYAASQPPTLIANANVETVAISNDGQSIFGNGAQTQGWNINTGLPLTGFPLPFGSPDGDLDGGGFAAGGGTLASKLFLNYASYNATAQILEFDLTNPTATPLTIVQVPGGDDDESTYAVSPDPNGSILLFANSASGGGTSTILRLTPPAGASFGVPAGKIIVTRDDSLHRYAPFSIVSPNLSAQSAKPAAFDLVGFSGFLSQGNMQRAGQLAYTNDGTFDVQWGLTSALSAGLSTLSAAQTSVNLAASDPYTYSVNWPVSGDFLAEVQGNLGADYTASLLDQISSACGNYNVADQPHRNWPYQKNILTLLISPNSGQLLIPAGRCLDMTPPGSDVPDNNAHWDILFNGVVAGSSGNPQGWDVEADHSLYNGLTVTVPAGAAASPASSPLGGYEVRFLAQQPGEISGSAGFSVSSTDTTSRAAILRPLTLSASGVTGAATVTGTVSLDAPAPAGGATVTLTSTDPQNAAVSAPGYVVIPAGATTSPAFTITTQAVTALEHVQIQASYNGYRVAGLTLRDSSGSAPSAPVLGASGGNNSVSLSWSPAARATSYTLLRGTRHNGPYTLLFSGVTGTQYLDKGVTNGKTYYYVMTASNDYGTSPLSNEASASPSGGAVAPPSFSSNPANFTAQSSIQAILSDATPSAVIHYTLDGSTPSISSQVYSSPITLNATTTVQALAERTGYLTSTIASQQYAITTHITIQITVGLACGSMTPNTSLSAADGWSLVQGAGYYGHDYTFSGTAGTTVTLTVHGTETTPLDTVLFLMDSTGKVVAANDDGPNPPDAQITFTLPATGTYTAEVSTYKPGATGNYTLNLACVAAGAPQLTVTNGAATQASGTTLAFGSVAVGNSTSQTLTLKNTGTAELDLGLIQIPAGFTLTQAPTNPVQPGMSTTMTLSFAPANAQAYSGVLSVASNDPASPYSLTLTGTGTSGATGGPVALASLGLAPDPVIGGLPSVGTVTLTSAALAGGFQVTLSSGPPALVTVPASVTVLQGATTATFPISTTAVSTRTDVPVKAAAGGATAPGILTLLPQTAAPAPIITPPSRTFSSASPLPPVQITDSLAGATIYYTLDGSDPTSSATRTIYTAALTITATTTLRAAVSAPGYLISAITSATYTLLLPPSVALTAPITGSQLTAGIPVTVTATASAPSGTVAQVVFYTGSTVIGQAASSPYTIVWPGGAAGQTVVLTAVATDSNGLTATSAPVSVTFIAPPAGLALASLSLSPDPVTGGQSVTGTVTLTGAAPSAGAKVSLTTTDAAHAPVLVSVTVPAGQTTATFTIATTSVTAQATPTIGASYGGATATETLIINPVGTSSGPILSSLQLLPDPVTGGTSVTGTVTLSAAAPNGGASVSLSTSDTALAYSALPSGASAFVSQGATTATFTVTTKAVSSPQNVSISASYGGATATGTLVINPGAAAIPISCGQILADALSLSDGVSLNPAFAGSGTHYARRYTFTPAVSGNYIVALTTSSFDPALSLITASGYTAPSSGQAVFALTNGTPYAFEVSTNGSGQTGAFTLRLTCPAGSGPAMLNVTNGSAPVPNDPALTGTAFSFGTTPQGVPLMKTFTLTNSGGTDLAITGLMLAGDYTIVGAVPSLVPAGGQATLTLRFNATGLGTALGSVVIGNDSATNPYQFRTTAAATSAAALPTVLSVTPATPSVTGGSPQTETVTLSAAAPSGGLSVTLASSNAAVASVPASVAFGPGQTTATFTATTVSVSTATPVTLSATLGGSSASATLTVNPSGTPPAITLAVGPSITATAPGSFTLTPTLTPAAGTTITKVEFFASGKKIGETTATPFVFTWTNVPVGSYALTAKVTDSRSLTATSSSVPVTVTAAPTLSVVISPPGGTFSTATVVTLAAQNSGGTAVPAQIYYTLDGNLWKLYTQPLTLVQTTTLTAKAVATGYANSLPLSKTFYFNSVLGGNLAVEILSPADSLGQTSTPAISAPAPIQAGISAASNWQLSYQLNGDTTWVPFASGSNTAPVGGGTLATWDTTLLVNGLYQIQLTAVDAAGHSATAQIEVLVQGGQKVGYFTLSYNDLTVPVAGFPLSITRTYDSRVKTPGDFGVGWTLSTNNVRLQKSPGAIGDNWQQQKLPGLIPSYYVSSLPGFPHTVSLTFPDGQVYSFAAVLGDGTPSVGGSITGDTLHWVQQSGPKGTSLTPVNASPDVYTSDTSGPISLFNQDDSGTSTGSFDCNEFVLQTRDGRQFDILAGSKAQGGGLQWVRDLNGNRLTFSASGITSSSGPAITFQRGGINNSITSISVQVGGQMGPAITYVQDGAGDLKSVTDRASNTSTYDYDPTHLLTGLNDPRGLTPLRNYYDGNGRLIYSLDGNNNKISYDYAGSLGGGQAANTEATTDRLGNQTLLGYDGYGNVTSTTRYLKKADGTIDHAIKTYSSYGDTNNPDKKTQDVDALGRQSDYKYDPATGDLLTVTQYRTKGDLTSAITTTTAYNGFGQPLTVTDPLGHVVSTNNYDAQGNLKWTQDALLHETDFSYNANGTLQTTKDAKSNVTSYGYGDPNNPANVMSVTDAQQHVTSFTYDFDGNKKTQTTTRLNAQNVTETLKTQFSYDGDDHLTMAVAPDGATSQTFYTSLGKVDYTLDALSRKTTYRYDNLGQATGVTYPDGTSTGTTYDLNGQRIASTDKAGRMSATIYDSLGRTVMSGPVSVAGSADGKTLPTWLVDTNNKPLVSTTLYDDAGQVTSSKDALNRVTGITLYDNLGRTSVSTDALLHTTTYAYDDDGRQLSVTDANLHTTSYDYDDAGRLTVTHYPDGVSTSSTEYDELGRRISQTDQAGHKTRYEYDTLGRLVKVTDPMGHASTFGYDALGEKTSQTDANGHVTYFAYDNRGRLVTKTLPLGQSDNRTYDTLGRLFTMTDFNGKMTAFGYYPAPGPSAGRLMSKTASVNGMATGESVSFTYNTDGTRATATRTTASGGSVQTVYAYYPNGDFRQGQLKSVTTQTGAGPLLTISYNYDLLGNKTGMTTPSGKAIGYGYDILNRLQTVTHPDNAVTTFGYDKVGNRQSVTRATSTGIVFSTTGYTYDTLNRLTDIVNKNGSSTVVSSYHYGLRLDGKRGSVIETGPATNGGTTNYTYDDQGKLTQEAGPYATLVYTYDNVGNRLTRIVTGSTTALLPNGTTTNTYDLNDRIATVNGSATHSYDLDGNETTVNGQTAGYDFENHLVRLGNGVANYVYDADGNRVSVSNAGTTTSYVVDTSLPYASVVEEYTGGSATPSARYDYGDDLVRMDRGSGVYYYLYDGLGSTRQFVNTGGTVTDTWGYSAFGEMASHTGSTINPFLFNAQQFDQASGDYYLRARYYDQSNGRFISQDPYSGSDDPVSLHRYLYASVDPIDRDDPGGEYDGIISLSFSLAINVGQVGQQEGPKLQAGVFAARVLWAANVVVASGIAAEIAIDRTKEETAGQPIIWRAISFLGNRKDFNFRPDQTDADGLSGTKGGVNPYWTDPALWFETQFGRSPIPGEDAIVGATTSSLIDAGISVIDSPRVGIDDYHVSIGSVTPGVAPKPDGGYQWNGSKSLRRGIVDGLTALFTIPVLY